MAGIFVSHAHADSDFLEQFIDQVVRLGCKQDEIFYSSDVDSGIPSGSDLNSYVKDQVGSASLVVAIISPSFRRSPYCLAELGAAWARVGALFPIAVPGFKYEDLDGVLQGTLVRHMDDTAALDELHVRICRATGTSVDATTWGKHKARWLAVVEDQARKLPDVPVLSVARFRKLSDDLQGSQDALREALAENSDLEEKLKRLAALKDATQVKEILLPKGEKERFEALQKAASTTLGRLPKIVREAVWYDLRGESMTQPERGIDRDRADQARAAVEEGYLIENDEEQLEPDADDFPQVKEAVEAVAKLDSFLRKMSDESESFVEWFRSTFQASPNLRKKLVWEKVI